MPSEPLYLPLPELLPRSRQALREAAISLFSASAESPGWKPPAAHATGNGHHEYDACFQVVRVAQEPASAFLNGFLGAYLKTRESGRLDEHERRDLVAGLEHLLDFAGSHAAYQQLPRPNHHAYETDQRGLIGHQLYLVLLQGTIVGLNCFMAAGVRGNQKEADAALRLAVALLRSSVAGIKLAGGCRPFERDRTGQPAEPARAAGCAGFAGLRSSDHAYLVRIFRRLRSVFTESTGLGATRERLIAAVMDAYAAHGSRRMCWSAHVTTGLASA